MKCGRLGLVCLFAAVLLAHCAFEAEARTKLRFRSQDLKPRDEIASVTLPTILMESQATVTVRGEEDDAEAEQAGTAMDEETDDAEGEAEMEAEEERNAEHQAGVKPALLVAAGLADQPEEPAGDDDLLAANPVGDALLRNFENAEAGPGPAADAETGKDESEENPTAASPSAPAAASEAKPSAAAVSKDPNQAANSADEEEVADTKASKAVPAAPAAVPKAAETEHKGDDADDVTSIVKTNHAEEDEANPESVKEAAALKAAEANARAPSDESAESDNFYPHLNSAPHRHAVSQNGGSPLERLLNDPDDINWYDNAYSAAYPAAVKASADAPNVHDAHRFKAAPAPAEAKKSEESSEDADDDDENSEESSEGGAFAALKVFKFSKDHSHGAAPAPATAVPANKLKGGLANGVTHTQNAAKVGENSKDEAEAPKPKKPKIPPHSAGTDRELNELEVAVKQEEDRALAEAAKQKPSAKASKRSSRSKSDPHGWSKEFPDLSASIATSFLQLQQKIRAQKKDVSGDDFASLSPSANPYMTGASLAYASSAFGSMEDLAESAALDLGDISTSDLDFDLTPRSRHHRFRALAPTGYQAPVPPTPTGYQAPVTPTPTPTTPASGYQGPTPPPTPPPAPYGGPVPPYGGPVPPYGAPVPPPPAPYGGKVPPYGGPVPPYGGPVPPPPAYGGKPPGYGGQVPPPPYGGYMGGYQGKVQVPVDKLPTFGIPAEYMAAFKKGALVLLRGPAGPKGDQGIQGPTGSVNATVLKEIASLKKKIEKIKNNKVRMEAIERKVYPFWAAEPYACPDEWLNLGYVESEQRIFCRPPEDGSNVGNPACRSVAKFPKRYDRCTWSIHCQVEWKNYGCWPFGVARPKEYTDAQESKIPQLVVLPGQDGPAETPGHPKMIPNFVPVMPTSQADELKLAQDIVGRVLNPTADPLLVSKPKGLKLPPQWNPTDANTDRNLNAGGL